MTSPITSWSGPGDPGASRPSHRRQAPWPHGRLLVADDRAGPLDEAWRARHPSVGGAAEHVAEVRNQELGPSRRSGRRLVAHEPEVYGSHGMRALRYDAMLAMVPSGRISPYRLIGDLVDPEWAVPRIIGMDADAGTGMSIINAFS